MKRSKALRRCSGQAFGSFDPPEKRDIRVELKPLARSVIASICLGFKVSAWMGHLSLPVVSEAELPVLSEVEVPVLSGVEVWVLN